MPMLAAWYSRSQENNNSIVLFNNLELRPNKAKHKMVKFHTQFTIC